MLSNPSHRPDTAPERRALTTTAWALAALLAAAAGLAGCEGVSTSAEFRRKAAALELVGEACSEGTYFRSCSSMPWDECMNVVQMIVPDCQNLVASAAATSSPAARQPWRDRMAYCMRNLYIYHTSFYDAMGIIETDSECDKRWAGKSPLAKLPKLP